MEKSVCLSLLVGRLRKSPLLCIKAISAAAVDDCTSICKILRYTNLILVLGPFKRLTKIYRVRHCTCVYDDSLKLKNGWIRLPIDLKFMEFLDILQICCGRCEKWCFAVILDDSLAKLVTCCDVLRSLLYWITELSKNRVCECVCSCMLTCTNVFTTVLFCSAARVTKKITEFWFCS